MARPREFDRDEALERAMHLFWERGFEATSIQDLLDHMGINRGSLYDTFGDKQNLFLEALDRYRENYLKCVVEQLKGPGSGRNAIEEFFAGIIEKASSGESACGCFVANEQVERGGRCKATEVKLHNCLCQIEEALTEAVARAQSAGEISSRFTPRALARYLSNAQTGMMVAVKCCPDRAALSEVVEVTLSILDA